MPLTPAPTTDANAAPVVAIRRPPPMTAEAPKTMRATPPKIMPVIICAVRAGAPGENMIAIIPDIPSGVDGSTT